MQRGLRFYLIVMTPPLCSLQHKPQHVMFEEKKSLYGDEIFSIKLLDIINILFLLYHSFQFTSQNAAGLILSSCNSDDLSFDPSFLFSATTNYVMFEEKMSSQGDEHFSIKLLDIIYTYFFYFFSALFALHFSALIIIYVFLL